MELAPFGGRHRYRGHAAVRAFLKQQVQTGNAAGRAGSKLAAKQLVRASVQIAATMPGSYAEVDFLSVKLSALYLPLKRLQRGTTIGEIEGRLLAIARTSRGGGIRMTAARKANGRKREKYDEALST
jgi:uncharacterized DUF497 family protein